MIFPSFQISLACLSTRAHPRRGIHQRRPKLLGQKLEVSVPSKLRRRAQTLRAVQPSCHGGFGDVPRPAQLIIDLARQASELAGGRACFNFSLTSFNFRTSHAENHSRRSLFMRHLQANLVALQIPNSTVKKIVSLIPRNWPLFSENRF